MSLAGFSAASINFGLNVPAVGVTLPLQIDGALVSNSLTNVAVGSAAAPSYSFTGDTDTGIYRPAANELALVTGGVERMRIDAGGTALLPGGTIELGVGRVSDGFSYIDFHSQASVDLNARIIRSSGVNGSFMIAQTGSGPLVFVTANAERMSIGESGAIALGSPGNTVHVIHGVVRFQKTEATGGFRTVTTFYLDSGSTACGGIHVINGSTLPQFFTGSDERLKSNIQDDNTDYLSKINKVKLKTFTLNSDESQTTQHGVIAQELQMVFPDLVSEGEDGMLRVGSDYSYKLIGAIQELSAKNGALEARLAALESK